MRIQFIALCGAVLMTSGCAVEMAAAPPRLETIQAVRSGNVPVMAAGEFTQASDKVVGNTITVRAGVMKPPSGGSFPAYLRDTLINELRAGGKFAPDSKIVITGRLTQSEVSSSQPTGHAKLAAIFIVTKAGKTIYQKELSASSEWESGFMGAIAIPKAMDGYIALYSTLVAKLVADPEFLAAVKG
jgi:hypothetical protein